MQESHVWGSAVLSPFLLFLETLGGSMSQLLARLDAQQQKTSDPIELAQIKARRCCYLSRIGRFEESRYLIADLRKEFGAGQNSRISIWIMLAEGIVEMFQNISSVARDRIARAQLIALAVQDRELGAITSAWKAHADFEISDFDGMLKSLTIAKNLADSGNLDAQIRIAITMSNCFFLCGDRDSGQIWFMRCRNHAIAAGDQATTDALLYNRAAFGVASLRARRCFSDIDQSLLTLVHLEVASARNFQLMTQDLSLTHLIELCDARVLLMKNDFVNAYNAFERVRSASPFAKYNFSEAMIDLEMAMCANGLGRLDEATELCRLANNFDFSALDIDDQLVAAWMKSQLAVADNECGDVAESARMFAEISERYVSHRSTLEAKAANLAATWTE
jgi:tetratricopeptide (TPR) repeat protein